MNLQTTAAAAWILGSFMIPTVASFQTVGQQHRSASSAFRTTSGRKHMLPADVVDPFLLEHLSTSMQQLSQHNGGMLSLSAADVLASSQLLAAEAAEKTGWWQSYLNIFKSTLQLVHSTIDGPLRSVGIDQTWGVSIFIFTAGT